MNYPYRYYQEIDSTNEEAKRLISSGKISETSYIVADSQTAGKGTRGRVWSSPEGIGLYLSIVHIPKEKEFFETTTLYTLASGVACVEVLKEEFDIGIKLKPINDLYFGDKKLGGILVESRLGKEGMSSLITGIGINIKKYDHSLDRDEISPISLEEIVGEVGMKAFKKNILTDNLVSKICFWYEELCRDKSLIEKTWNKYSLNFV
jgi:BirA family biotin operon repressor/biotin-[acetyl-CoA-carboxylase] ligase